MANMTHVEGEDKGHILLFALSTCVWCKKTKEILNNLGVAYSYIDVDQLAGDDRTNTVDEVKSWNPKCSFPTLVINKEKCIVGPKEEEIKEALGI